MLLVGVSENLKTFSISSKIAAADAAAAAASAAAVLKEIEHVFEFSDASICVIGFWSKPSVFHRKPSLFLKTLSFLLLNMF